MYLMTLTELDNIHHSNGEVLDKKKLFKKKFNEDDNIRIYDCVKQRERNIKVQDFKFGNYWLVLNIHNKYMVVKMIIQ